MHIVVLTPVLDDWVSAEEVLKRLDKAFSKRDLTLSVLIVDDGSAELPPATFALGPYAFLQQIDILRLKKNLGHQRAIAMGLCHAADKIPCDAVLVMDADGEDDPSDAVRLIARLIELNAGANAPIVFAERTRRSESFVFQFGYLGYRTLHALLTGRGIRFGNFSIIPRSRLTALVTEPMLWNHYAAAVAGSRVPYTTIPTNRGLRIAGQSRLNFVGLVVHGLSALACYGEIIGVRLIIAGGALLFLAVLGLGILIGLKLFTTLPVPGWTSLLLVLIIGLMLQIATMVGNFTMQIISGRSSQPFLPARDYSWFVSDFKTLYRKTS